MTGPRSAGAADRQAARRPGRVRRSAAARRTAPRAQPPAAHGLARTEQEHRDPPAVQVGRTLWNHSRSMASARRSRRPRINRATSCPTGPAAVFRGVDLATSRSGATVAWRVGRRDLPTVLAGTGIAATGIHAPGVRTIHGNRGSARVSTATAVPVGRVFGPAPGRRTRRFLRSIVEADQATWATAAQRREDLHSTAAVLRPRTGSADGAAGRARPSQFGVSAVCRRHRSGRHRGASRCVLPPRSHTAPQQDSTVRRRQRSPPRPHVSARGACPNSSTRPQLASFRQLPSDVGELHIEPLRRAA